MCHPALAQSLRPRAAAQRLGRLTESAQKGAAHALRVAEADLGGDGVDRLGARLDPFARRFEAQPLDGLGRA